MSRTKRGSKPPGFDYWGKRGIEDKTTTKRKERAKAKQKLIKDLQYNQP